MFIINDKPGQLCNQLWSYIPLISRALKYKVTFITLYFEDNYYHFENLNTFDKIKFGFFGIRILDIYFRKILLNTVRLLPSWFLKVMNIYVDHQKWKNESWDEDLLKDNKSKIFLGSGYRREDVDLLKEFHQQICLIFRPKQVYIEKVSRIIATEKKKFDVIVGVHIRRGDYKEFFKGIYYFDDETYFKYMKSMNDELKINGQKIGFLICSNEKLSLSNFDSLCTFQIDNANAIEDLFALSLCSYIIGPPSTFSMWASYYGKVPLRFLKYEDENVTITDFSEIVAQDIFANDAVLTHVSIEPD